MKIDDLYRSSIATEPDEPGAVVSVGATKVLVREDAPAEDFIEFLREHTQPGKGVFQEMTLDDLESGPSYIAVGAWLGSQTYAMVLMGLGKHHGAWDIVTPATFGFEPGTKEYGVLAGSGLIMIAGLKPEFRARIEGGGDSTAI